MFPAFLHSPVLVLWAQLSFLNHNLHNLDMQGSSVASPHLGSKKFLPGLCFPSTEQGNLLISGFRNGSSSGKMGKMGKISSPQLQQSWQPAVTPKGCSGGSPNPQGSPFPGTPPSLPIPSRYSRSCQLFQGVPQPPQPHNLKKNIYIQGQAFPLMENSSNITLLGEKIK